MVIIDTTALQGNRNHLLESLGTNSEDVIVQKIRDR